MLQGKTEMDLHLCSQRKACRGMNLALMGEGNFFGGKTGALLKISRLSFAWVWESLPSRDHLQSMEGDSGHSGEGQRPDLPGCPGVRLMEAAASLGAAALLT